MENINPKVNKPLAAPSKRQRKCHTNNDPANTAAVLRERERDVDKYSGESYEHVERERDTILTLWVNGM